MRYVECWQKRQIMRRKWIFATNSDVIILISLQPDVEDLGYFKIWILLDHIVYAWNIQDFNSQGSQRYRIYKIGDGGKLSSFINYEFLSLILWHNIEI